MRGAGSEDPASMFGMRASALAICVLALGAQPVPPQQPASSQTQPPPATGAISGVVVDESTGAPIADAIVYLSAAGRAVGVQPRQFTDARGRFVFAGLPASPTYSLSATKGGYLTGGHSLEGLPGARGGLVTLEEGEWISTVRIVLTRTGAISGAVLDETGEPVVGVYVRLLARIPIQGRPHLAAGPLTTTDDRGAYRFGGLAPGRYLVAVPATQATVPASAPFGSRESPVPALDVTPSTRLIVGRYPLPPPSRDGSTMAYPFTFFPGTHVAGQAGVIELKSGDDRTGADVRLDPAPTGRISGVVEGPAERLTLRLLAEGLEGLGHGAETATALVAADGRFDFLNVPAGTYTLDAPLTLTELAVVDGPRGSMPARVATPPGIGGWSMNSSDLAGAPPGVRVMSMDFRSGAKNFAARTTVTVRGGDTTSVRLQLLPPGRMTGRLVIDPGSPKPTDGSTPALPSLRLEPAGGDLHLGLLNSEVDPKGPKDVFTIDGIRTSPYVLRVIGTQWMIKTAVWRGRDYADEPFDATTTPGFDDVTVTVTRAAPVLSGVVRDERGRPGDAAVVIIFPIQPKSWTNYGVAPARLKMARTSNTGAYRLLAPPGDYYLIAVPAAHAAAWQDPAYLEKATAGAVRVSLEWGGQASRDLVIK